MSHSAQGRCRVPVRVPSILCILVLLVLCCPSPGNAQVIAQYDFEDATTQGWASFNNAGTPVNSTAAAHSGMHSLLTTTNSAGAGGPGINLTNLVPGASYQITGFIMLAPGTPATAANLTMQRSDPGCSGGTCFDTIGNFQVAVSDSGWAQVGGTYTVSSTATGLLLYAQLIGPTAAQSFYLDDVVINEIAGPPGGPQDNSGISTNFEDGGLDGWTSRAGAKLANSTADFHTGSHSLLVTGRTAAFDGPQISVSNKMYNGSTYSVSVWVKLAATATQADTLRVSLQTTLAGSTSFHTVVGNTPVPLGTWVQLSIPQYAMAFAYDPGQAFLYVESNSGTQDFYSDDFQLTFIPPPVIQKDIPSIFETLAHFFPVGAEVDSTDLTGVHAQLLTKHFNSIVSGNDMKWDAIEPQEGKFTFATADAEVSFAKANGLLMRGHNLVWANGSQTPAWVFLEEDGKTPLSASNPADVALLTQRIQNHIMNEVEHFGSAIYVWDVINEPLDSSQPDCLSHGPFYQVLGASYLAIALRAARQFAPPGTQLFINDFNTSIPARFQCLVQLVTSLRQQGVPLDGVGHENHQRIDFPAPQDVFATIRNFAEQFPDLHQQVTELDVSVYKGSDNTSNYGANGGTVPDSIVAAQGWLYEAYFDVFRKLRGKLDAVTFWGIADDNTWLDNFPIHRLDLPLPFDTRLQAKPAYYGIVDPTKLPGFGLSFAVVSKTGPRDSRIWTLEATNPSSATASATQITGFTLRRDRDADEHHRGEHDFDDDKQCTPTVTPSTFPIVVGDIAANSTASVSFTVDFSSCPRHAEFTLVMPWSSATYETGSLVLEDQRP